MNAEVFERWFANRFTPDLPKDRKVVVVLDNAKYHSRLVEKISNLIKHRIEIPLPLPVKSLLLQNFVKQIFRRNMSLMRWS